MNGTAKAKQELSMNHMNDHPRVDDDVHIYKALHCRSSHVIADAIKDTGRAKFSSLLFAIYYSSWT